MAVVLVAAVALGSGAGSDDPAEGDVVLEGSDVELRLDDQLRSRSADAVSGVDCPDDEFLDGDTATCSVILESGREQQIEVLVSGTAKDPRLEIGVSE